MLKMKADAALVGILVLLSLGIISILSQTSNQYPDYLICYNNVSTAKDFSTQMDGLSFLQSQLKFKNCTHIIGSLVVAHLRPGSNGQDPDLSFLHRIVDISDYLYVFNVSLNGYLSFPELRVIRGRRPLSITGSDGKVVEVAFGASNNIGLKKVSMPNLLAIMSSNVRLQGNTDLCHLGSSVNWTLIFDSPQQSTFYPDLSQRDTCPAKATCAPTCATSSCFGETGTDCQTDTKCKQRRCPGGSDIARCNQVNGIEECCPSVCAGGCNVKLCSACRVVKNNGACVNICPERLVTIDGQRKQNPDFAFTLGPVCVKTCPPPFVADGDSCAFECSQAGMEPRNGVCSPCTSAKCPKKCNMADIRSQLSIPTGFIGVDSRILKALSGCDHLTGDLVINKFAFRKHPQYSNVAVSTPQELYDALISLRTISGRLVITEMPGFISNFTFLQNLEEVRGEVTFDASDTTPMIVADSNVEFLGLKKLRRIGNVWNAPKLKNLPYLCYQPNVSWWDSITDSDLQLKEENVKLHADCVSQSKTCHSSCSAQGCWGPGPSQCVSCQNVDANGICAEKCSDVSGFYAQPDNPKVCLPCSPWCAGSCSGPLATQCLGGCKFVKDGDECLPQCPNTKFENPTTRQCEPCHSVCSVKNKTIAVCSGPSAVPGPGGCTACDTVLLDSNGMVMECVGGTGCPDSNYYDSVASTPELQRVFLDQLEHYYACRPCPPLCPKCVHGRTDKTACPVCIGVRYKDNCQETCPYHFYPRVIDAASNNTECNACHDNCKGCTGPGNYSCTECARLKVYIDDYLTGDRKQFYCNYDTCPVDKPEKTPEQQVHVCISTVEMDELNRRHRVMVAVIVVCALLLLAVLAVVGVLLWRWRRNVETQRLIEKLKDMLSNADSAERRSTSDTKTPLLMDEDRLIVASLDDLFYPPDGRPLPKGRFGEVFQGKWRLPAALCLHLVKSKDRLKLPVAVRVISLEDFVNYDAPTRVQTNVTEIKALAAVDDRHCLRLLGCHFDEQNCYLISVFREKGSLDKYLRDNNSRIFAHTLLYWAEQVAQGMAYLAEVKIVHRNLAARNIMLVDESLLQITDFGLAKLMKSNPLTGPNTPMRWLAIETLRDGQYSTFSDVWAYGVTLWEMFTFGKVPYDDVDVVDIQEHVEKGGRLQHPAICSLDVFLLMVKCWMEDPGLRVPFTELANKFHEFSQRPTTYLSIAGDPAMKAHSPQDEENYEMDDMENPIGMEIGTGAGDRHTALISPNSRGTHFFPPDSRLSDGGAGASRLSGEVGSPFGGENASEPLLPMPTGKGSTLSHAGDTLNSRQSTRPATTWNPPTRGHPSFFPPPNEAGEPRYVPQPDMGIAPRLPPIGVDYLEPTARGGDSMYLEPGQASGPSDSMYLEPGLPPQKTSMYLEASPSPRASNPSSAYLNSGLSAAAPQRPPTMASPGGDEYLDASPQPRASNYLEPTFQPPPSAGHSPHYLNPLS